MEKIYQYLHACCIMCIIIYLNLIWLLSIVGCYWWWMKIKVYLFRSVFWQLSDHEKSGRMWQVARYRTQIVCHRDLFCANTMLSYRRQIKTTHNIKRPIKTWRYFDTNTIIYNRSDGECLGVWTGSLVTWDMGDTIVGWPCRSAASGLCLCWISKQNEFICALMINEFVLS